jgi:hypothetical protein
MYSNNSNIFPSLREDINRHRSQIPQPSSSFLPDECTESVHLCPDGCCLLQVLVCIRAVDYPEEGLRPSQLTIVFASGILQTIWKAKVAYVRIDHYFTTSMLDLRRLDL